MITDYFPKDKRGRAVAVYFMGVYVGVGLAFIVGGFVVEMASSVDQIIIPLIGEIRAWQLTFMIVGIPGLVLVALMATVKEPYRREMMVGSAGSVDLGLGATIGFFKTHGKAYTAIFLGFSLCACFALAYFLWIPTLFTRLHGWEVADIGYAFGLIVMVMGTLGIIVAGVIADRILQAGQHHAYIRVATWSMVGALIFGLPAVLVDNALTALLLLCPTVFCLGMPVSMAPASINHMTPNQFRGQAIAIYIFVVALISGIIGPISAGLFTDYVFQDEMALDRSLAVVTVVFAVGAWLVLKISVPSYVRSATQVLTIEK
jgi:MFS family permease